MMISTEMYIAEVENMSYKEMIKERDSLIRKIRKYEKPKPCKIYDETDIEKLLVFVCPTPEIVYEAQLGYLAALLQLMQHKYREEYLKKNKTLF